MPRPEEEICGHSQIFAAIRWWRVLISQSGTPDTSLMEEQLSHSWEVKWAADQLGVDLSEYF